MNQILQPNKFWEKWHIFSFSKSPLIFHINPYLCEIRKIYFMHMGHREEEEKKLGWFVCYFLRSIRNYMCSSEYRVNKISAISEREYMETRIYIK